MDRNQSRVQNQVCIKKKDAQYLVGWRKSRNILKRHNKSHEIHCNKKKLETEVINKSFFSCNIYFQHDKAKPHVANMEAHPPYSPDLAPPDRHLFRI